MRKHQVEHLHEAEGGLAIGGTAEISTASAAPFNIRLLGRDLLHDVPLEVRDLLTRGLLDVLHAHPTPTPAEYDRLAHQAWEATRALEVRPGVTVETACQVPEIGSIGIQLRHAVKALVAAGGLRRTLTEQYEKIGRELARLEGLR